MRKPTYTGHGFVMRNFIEFTTGIGGRFHRNTQSTLAGVISTFDIRFG